MKIVKIACVIVLTLFASGCSREEPAGGSDGFDRQKMLINWADNIIVPAYEKYVASLNDLKISTTAFIETPNLEHLHTLREAWLDSYLDWQYVGMFQIGKAEELSLVNYTNIYPLGVNDMIETLEAGNYDFTEVNRQDEQGFPAIEYLLYGVRATDQKIIDLYSQELANHPYKIYLNDLVDRLLNLASAVLTDWKSGYRDTFIANAGSEATSSVNKIVNNYIYYFEKHIRAGKVGIPAGVFSPTTFADKVEARFSGKSKVLFEAALDASSRFFNGNARGSNLAVEGIGLDDYLDYLNSIKDGDGLSELINDQFLAVKSNTARLMDDFGAQITDDNTKLLETYDLLQSIVVLLKVDMAQAMSIGITYMDADGD